MNPKLSVVVGSQNARHSIVACLDSLRQQRSEVDTEIIVADNSTDGTTDIVAQQFPEVTLIRLPVSHFIPELWGAGISNSCGEIVALTTAHCVPEQKWMNAVLEAHHDTPYAGIGGAIENAPSAGLVEWAVYFCRYAPFMRPFVPHVIADIPGDNASYKRWALDKTAHVWRHGFWEPDVHAELRKGGYELYMNPTVGVQHMKSFSFWGFMRNRFWHGRQFGQSRTARLSFPLRIAYIGASPLIPLVFVARITKHLLKKKRALHRYVLSFPILLLFLLSWAAGELSGYVWSSHT